MANDRSQNKSNAIGTEISIQKIVAVGATAVLISSKRERVSIYLRNIGTDGSRISLQFSNTQPAADNTGIILNQNEFTIDSNSEGYKCWSGDITAIASTANGVLSVVER
jgi:hypothetical protein